MELIERRITLRKSHKRQRVLRMISGALMGILLTVLFLFGWFSPLYIADHSMEPTLMQGDAIVYDRLYKHFIELRRSDMVVFRHPVSGDMMIKRIVGLPGETVSAEDGMLLIDKFALAESDYLLPADKDRRHLSLSVRCEACARDLLCRHEWQYTANRSQSVHGRPRYSDRALPLPN